MNSLHFIMDADAGGNTLANRRRCLSPRMSGHERQTCGHMSHLHRHPPLMALVRPVF